MITSQGIEQTAGETPVSLIDFPDIVQCRFRVRRYSPLKYLIVALWRIPEAIGTGISLSTWSGVEIRYTEKAALEFYRHQETVPSLTVACNEPNFYPGLEIIKPLLPNRFWPDEFSDDMQF